MVPSLVSFPFCFMWPYLFDCDNTSPLSSHFSPGADEEMTEREEDGKARSRPGDLKQGGKFKIVRAQSTIMRRHEVNHACTQMAWIFWFFRLHFPNFSSDQGRIMIFRIKKGRIMIFRPNFPNYFFRSRTNHDFPNHIGTNHDFPTSFSECFPPIKDESWFSDLIFRTFPPISFKANLCAIESTVTFMLSMEGVEGRVCRQSSFSGNFDSYQTTIP